MVALVLADALLEKFGGDNMEDIAAAVRAQRAASRAAPAAT